jgi:hypothetical protein
LCRAVAQHRPEVSNQLKKQLRREAGDKCANPGCAATRTHLHHIRQWAVYQTHDGEHMIAVCPNCHDAIHHGDIPISDETLYEWKRIPRSGDEVRGHLYVEPGSRPRILIGTVALTGPEGVVVFRLGTSQDLSFRTSGAELVLVHLRLVDVVGEEVLLIRDNYVVHKPRPEIDYSAVPGRIQVTAPADSTFVPKWALAQVRIHAPEFGQNGRVTLAAVSVLAPSLVRVEGVWMSGDTGIIITDSGASFLKKGDPRPLTIAGAGRDTVLDWRGPITSAIFDFLGPGSARPG